MFAKYRVEADVVDVDRLEGEDRSNALKAVKQYNQRVSFPTTVIGDEVIVGNKIDRIKKALEEPPPSNDERR